MALEIYECEGQSLEEVITIKYGETDLVDWFASIPNGSYGHSLWKDICQKDGENSFLVFPLSLRLAMAPLSFFGMIDGVSTFLLESSLMDIDTSVANY